MTVASALLGVLVATDDTDHGIVFTRKADAAHTTSEQPVEQPALPPRTAARRRRRRPVRRTLRRRARPMRARNLLQVMRGILEIVDRAEWSSASDALIAELPALVTWARHQPVDGKHVDLWLRVAEFFRAGRDVSLDWVRRSIDARGIARLDDRESVVRASHLLKEVARGSNGALRWRAHDLRHALYSVALSVLPLSSLRVRTQFLTDGTPSVLIKVFAKGTVDCSHLLHRIRIPERVRPLVDPRDAEQAAQTQMASLQR